MTEYKTANLSPKTVLQLQRLERILSRETGQTIVLVAYKQEHDPVESAPTITQSPAR